MPNPALVRTVRLRRPAAQLSRWASRRIRSRSLNARMFGRTEPLSECKRRIRLRHVATSFDLVAILVRVN